MILARAYHVLIVVLLDMDIDFKEKWAFAFSSFFYYSFLRRHFIDLHVVCAGDGLVAQATKCSIRNL